MHRELVEKRRWVPEERFFHALIFCLVRPGPKEKQLATYLGWLMYRTWGGVPAGISYGIKPAVAAAMTAAVVGVIANCALFFIAAVACPESASGSFNAQTHGVGFLLALGDCGLAALEVRRDPGYRRVGGHRAAAALVWLGPSVRRQVHGTARSMLEVCP